MKQILILLMLCLLFAQNLKAQENTSVRFGLRAGLNLSYMDFSKGSPPPDIPIETNWEPGLVAGLVVVVPLYKNFHFQPEYLFSQMGGELKELETKYTFNYLTLPVLIRWEYKSLYLTGGPQFELLINSGKEVQNSSLNDAFEVEERHIGVSVGIGYGFFNSLGIEVRYMKGFNHVGLVLDTGIQEFKYEMLQVSLIYLF